jgi:hypothetical protein
MAASTHLTHPELEARLDAVGWGLLFLVSGGILLLPDAPDGSWLTGVGAVLIAVTIAKAALGVGIGWFIGILGAVALASGLGQIAGFEVPGMALLLIACGAALIVAQVIRGPGAQTR